AAAPARADVQPGWVPPERKWTNSHSTVGPLGYPALPLSSKREGRVYFNKRRQRTSRRVNPPARVLLPPPPPPGPPQPSRAATQSRFASIRRPPPRPPRSCTPPHRPCHGHEQATLP